MDEKKLTLIDNAFSKNDLNFLLSTLITEKINFHKLNRLSNLEGNSNSNTTYDDNRIKTLTEIKSTLFEDIDDMGENFQVESHIIIRKIK